MSPPIDIDGSEIQEATIDGQDVSEITIDGQQTADLNVIPDSVVSRETDNDVISSEVAGNEIGMQIETDVEWPSIGAELSSNTIDPSIAKIYRVSDGTLLGSTDISGLTANDTFVVDDVNLQAYDNTLSTTYNFVITNPSTSWTFGFYDQALYPYTSSDGDLTIIAQADGATGSFGTVNVSCFSRIGDVGFN